MNTRIIIMALLVSSISSSTLALQSTNKVNLGDSESDVIEMLGKPQGKAQAGGVDIMFYERGTVELKDGKVIDVKLVSEEEAARKTEERLRREEERRRAKEAHRQKLIEEGEAEKKRIMADPAYTNMTAHEVVDYWDMFKGKYPDVPIDRNRYSVAQQELRAEREEAIKQAEAAKAAEKPPKPKISSKKKKKMKRAGTWIWD